MSGSSEPSRGEDCARATRCCRGLTACTTPGRRRFSNTQERGFLNPPERNPFHSRIFLSGLTEVFRTDSPRGPAPRHERYPSRFFRPRWGGWEHSAFSANRRESATNLPLGLWRNVYTDPPASIEYAVYDPSTLTPPALFPPWAKALGF